MGVAMWADHVPDDVRKLLHARTLGKMSGEVGEHSEEMDTTEGRGELTFG